MPESVKKYVIEEGSVFEVYGLGVKAESELHVYAQGTLPTSFTEHENVEEVAITSEDDVPADTVFPTIREKPKNPPTA